MSLEYNGYSAQDLFVIYSTNKKTNGTYLEIGTNHPINYNNTYVLESKYNWYGFLVEYSNEFTELYKLHRPKSYPIIRDATTINFLEEFEKVNFPKNIDYLQVDLDVDNCSTLTTLKNLNSQLFDSYKFATVTFEHDIYRGDYYNTRSISREIFNSHGYIRVFSDIHAGIYYGEYEDWYVHPELVNMDYINKIKTDTPSLLKDEVIKILEDNYQTH